MFCTCNMLMENCRPLFGWENIFGVRRGESGQNAYSLQGLAMNLCDRKIYLHICCAFAIKFAQVQVLRNRVWWLTMIDWQEEMRLWVVSPRKERRLWPTEDASPCVADALIAPTTGNPLPGPTGKLAHAHNAAFASSSAHRVILTAALHQLLVQSPCCSEALLPLNLTSWASAAAQTFFYTNLLMPGEEDFSGWLLSWTARHRFNPVT